jgi:hypothetical protein
LPIILATQEAEIRRIVVRGQLEQIVHKTLFQKYPAPKRAGGVAQVKEYLPNKHKALSSNLVLPKKREGKIDRQKEREKQREREWCWLHS